ncbi:MAG TPA: nuclear transport factor 2 family protein [Kofleriaceae bacterium]|nr:nuclear transport factor 2 family protein [Kofleriaceae bacterium]
MPTPREVFDRAHALVRSYDIGYVDCFAPDGVLVCPFAPPGFPRRTEGRDAIRALLAPRYAAARASGRRIAEYRHVVVHDTADPEVIVVEFEAIGIERDGTTRYALPFIQVIRVRDGAIVEQRDYFDALAMTPRLAS